MSLLKSGAAFVASLGVMALTSLVATAQKPPQPYQWTITKPVAGTTYWYQQVPIEMTVKWGKNTKVGVVDIEVFDLAGFPLGRKATNLQFTSTATSLTYKGSIATSKLPGPDGDVANVEFTAREVVPGNPSLSTKTVKIKLRPQP